jgi:quercetin dioxygenase-like cupin family protein
MSAWSSRSVLGIIAAATVWLGWLTVAPALGFSSLASAAMLNLVVAPHDDPGSWPGWIILIAGLVVVAGLFVALARSGRVPARIGSGAVLGIICWLIAGIVLMPLLGLLDPATTATTADPMRGSLMMLPLGLGAPIEALIAWLAFGLVLGATVSVPAERTGTAPIAGEAEPGPPPTTSSRDLVLVLVGLVLALVPALALAGVRAESSLADSSSATTTQVARQTVASLPTGQDFISVIELSQAPGAVLGPHVHTYSGVAYGLDGVATIGFASSPTVAVARGQAGFIVAGQVHAHRNVQDVAAGALLAVALLVLVGIVVLLAARRPARTGLLSLALLVLIGTSAVAIQGPGSNDWLFISIRSAGGRNAEMPLATSERLFESPAVGPFAPGPYTETLDRVRLHPSSSQAFAPTGPTVIVVLDGSVDVQGQAGAATSLGSRGSTLVSPGTTATITDSAGEPAELLVFTVVGGSGD